MASKGTLTIKIVGDDSNFKRVVSGVGSGVKKIGQAVAVGTAAAAAGAVALGQEVLGTGAKLEAWRLKTTTVFEGSAADIRAWADRNNETFGLTDDQLAGLAASFGDLLKPMGFTADQAASMSKDVVGLAGALSEWTGGERTAAEVSDILAKAMLGERESLKELGISITEADVQARLAAKGQDKLTGSALEQAKALATQELIFEKSADAQKAYADGGNKALRASNQLKAGFAELRERLADKLLPVVLTVAQWIGDRVPGVAAAVQPYLQRLGDAFAAVGQFITGELLPPLQDLFTFLAEHQEILIGIAAAIGVGLVAAFASWAASAAAAAAATVAAVAPVIAIGAAIAALVAGLVWAYQNWEGFRNIVNSVAAFLTDTAWPAIQSFADFVAGKFGELVGWVQAHWGAIQEAISHVVNVIEGVIRTVIDVVSALWRAWGDDLVNIARTAWDFIRGTIENAINLVRSIIEAVLALINGDWGAAWDAIKGVLAAVWDQMVNVVTTAVNAVQSVIAGVVSTIQEVWRGLWGAMKDLVSGAWDGIKTVVSGGVDAIVGFVQSIPGRIADVARGAFDSLKNAFRSAINFIIDGWNGLQFRVPGFDPPGPGPTFGGFTLGVPDIPRLRDGGEVMRTGLAVVHRGERFSGTRGQVDLHDRRERPILVQIDARGATAEAVRMLPAAAERAAQAIARAVA